MYTSTFVINIAKRFTGFADKLIFAFRHIVSADDHTHSDFDNCIIMFLFLFISYSKWKRVSNQSIKSKSFQNHLIIKIS